MSTSSSFTIYTKDMRGETQFIEIETGTLTMHEDDKGVIEAYQDGLTGILYIKQKDGVLYAHRDNSLPACEVSTGECMFFIDGENYNINELPCDDITKTYMLLKYSKKSSDDHELWSYHVYM